MRGGTASVRQGTASSGEQVGYSSNRRTLWSPTHTIYAAACQQLVSWANRVLCLITLTWSQRMASGWMVLTRVTQDTQQFAVVSGIANNMHCLGCRHGP
jgi:hypothetical protein